jgi:AGZA family xanthine/uracil permease-like MFS transporter
VPEADACFPPAAARVCLPPAAVEDFPDGALFADARRCERRLLARLEGAPTAPAPFVPTDGPSTCRFASSLYPSICFGRLPRIVRSGTEGPDSRKGERGMAQTDEAPPRIVHDRGGGAALDRYFHISERGSTVRTEVIAGFATFLTMAYILFLNPAILGAVKDGQGTQLPFDQVLTVTALVAGCMTILMGVYGKYPFALAAGLGLNAFVAFSLVATDKLSWPQAMGVIVVEGLVISVLVLTGFRQAVLNAIPMDLKRAIGIGIGLFIAFIGLVNAGIVTHPASGDPIVGINSDLTTLRILTFAIGLLITATLVARKTRGALLIGIVSTTVIASLINTIWGHDRIWASVGPGIAQAPDKWVSAPNFDLVGNFSFSFFSALGFWTAVAVVLAVMLSDFFDTMGTVIGIGGEAKLLDKVGRLPGINRVLLVDSLAAAAGGAASASSNTTYIESAAGVSEGGRTGLTAVVVGVLFLLCLFISPLAGVIPPEATAPVLVIVGYFMMTLVKDIQWSDAGIGIPVLLTMAVMPFTYSITNGVGAGFVSYTLIAVFRGKAEEVHPLMYVISAIFIWYFVHGVV